MNQKDPKGYYAMLGVDPGASAADIKRAFRLTAKEVHPDWNKSEGATEAFQLVSEAYSVLKDPIKRAEYDALGAVIPEAKEYSEEEIEAPEPIVCSVCGKLSAQPRYVIFYEVKSFIVVTLRTPIQGIYCRSCADKKALRASCVTWLLGWWGLPWGPIYSVHAIIRNLFGGIKPRDVNTRLLGQQAWFLMFSGKIDVARSVASEAFKLSINKELSLLLKDLLASLDDGQPVHQLKSQWKLMNSAFFFQAALVILAIAVGIFAYIDQQLRSIPPREYQAYWGPKSLGPSPVNEKSTSFEDQGLDSEGARLWHVIVTKLNCRKGPGTKYRVVGTLRRFDTVEVMGPVANRNWLLVRTKNGISGFVSSKYLTKGSGSIAKKRWCMENLGLRPQNGAIFIQRRIGDHRLTIHNGRDDDALVKLKDLSGRTILSFYVRGQDKVEIDSVPEGSYRTQFACGKSYSNRCGFFMDGMKCLAFPNLISFQTKFDGNHMYKSITEYTLTLHRIPGGTIQVLSLNPQDFLED